jgi:hypothetical protein
VLAAAQAHYCTDTHWHVWMLWHPLCGNGYQAHSGVIGNLALISTFAAIVVAIAAWWRKHNCHVQGCPFLQWHAHPEHGHPVCKIHHPHGAADHLHARHHQHDHTGGFWHWLALRRSRP